ncbi:13654_t:CDS:1, partial [Dentiscutata heterogama]
MIVINSQLNKHIEIYKDWLGYDVNLLKKILKLRESPCQPSLWFLSPNYTQLATKTFSIPIAIFEEKNKQS